MLVGLLSLGTPTPLSASTGSWGIVSSANPGYLNAVSCLTANWCIAVGYAGNLAQAQHWNGSAWSAMPSPNPSGTSDSELLGISCVSVDSCTAVGEAFISGVQRTLVEDWNGTSWSVVPSPDQGNGDNILWGVSCVTSSFCKAVGYDRDTSSGNLLTLIESWDGSSWSIATSPVPGSGYSELRGVSCLSTSSCWAVGLYQAGPDQTLVESWSGTAWSIVASPNGTAYNELYAVSCTSSTSCIAAGEHGCCSGPKSQTLIESWDGTAWTIVPSPDLGSADNVLQGVSCVASASCIAVGSYYITSTTLATLILSWDGTSWTVAPSPNQGTGNNWLSAVSCVASTACMATGTTIETNSTPVPSVVDVSSSANPIPAGQPVTFTAALASGDGGGTMSFTSDGSPISGCGAVALTTGSDGRKQASCTTSSLTVGTHTITATYSGDATYAGGSASLSGGQNIQQATTTDVFSNLNPSSYTQMVTLIATNTTSDGGGTMSFLADGNPISGCSGLALVHGYVGYGPGSWGADCNVDTLTAATHAISATYSGDAHNAPSTGSLGGGQVVDKASTTTSLVSSLKPSATGQPVTFTATVSPGDGQGWVTFDINYAPVPACQSQPLQPTAGGYVASCTVGLNTGDYSITATYSGDANDLSSVGWVGQEVLPPPQGYWLVARDGGIFSFGTAGFHGSTGAMHLNGPIVGMAATPNGGGYWFVAADGGIFSFGDAQFYGSMGGHTLNAPIVGMAATPDGRGYWFVARDGGIFSFGDAGFYGSMGGQRLNAPIVGMAANPTGAGYWFVAADGGIFCFGNAGFYGSGGNGSLGKPIVGMSTTRDGLGYRFVAADGGIFAFGDAEFLGGRGGQPLAEPVVGLATSE